MQIFIPTRGRIDKQYTLDNLFLNSHYMSYQIYMIVPECEKSLWKNGDGKIIKTVPDNFGYSDIRQWILENFNTDPNHLVIDDDLTFYRRKENSTYLRKTNLEDIKNMLSWINNQFEKDFAHGGISAREGNNNIETSEFENTRMMRCCFYNANILNKHNIRCDDVICRMDFHITLSLLKLGYKNIVNFEFAHNQPNSGNSNAGGCSHYRSLKLMNEQALLLENLHKPYVKTYKKKTKTSYDGQERIAVKISWKKAWKDSPAGIKQKEENDAKDAADLLKYLE